VNPADEGPIRRLSCEDCKFIHEQLRKLNIETEPKNGTLSLEKQQQPSFLAFIFTIEILGVGVL